MKGIVWLASYPKSGNTWFRAFISNLLRERGEEISINRLKTDGIFSSRIIFDHITGIRASDLTADEVDRLRPGIYNHLAETAESLLFIKVHDAYTYLDDGGPLLGTVNARAVYLIRNPLDVAVSFANHSSADIDTIIRGMGNEEYAFCKNRTQLSAQLRQRLLTWSAHVKSWTAALELPVHVIRYEDMRLKPLPTFAEAVRFMGLEYGDKEIEAAVELSDFRRLKAEEEENGFREKIAVARSFFRKGEAGDWRNHLSEAQRDRIIADHGTMMRKFGYLDAEGRPVY
jgi:aryl sulfotransferase